MTLLLFYNMGIWILVFIMGGLVFIYFNIKLLCKLNITVCYVNICVYIILFKKKYYIHKKMFYKDFADKLIARYKRTKSQEKVKSHFKYLEYFRKISRYFIIKNILFYEESLEGISSFAIEFIVVNNILKKSLLNS